MELRLYKADVSFKISKDEKLIFSGVEVRTQYHIRLGCANGHYGWDGYGPHDKCDEELKVWYADLPDKITSQLRARIS